MMIFKSRILFLVKKELFLHKINCVATLMSELELR